MRAACGADLTGTEVTGVVRRQVFEAQRPPPPKVIEYRLVAGRLPGSPRCRRRVLALTACEEITRSMTVWSPPLCCPVVCSGRHVSGSVGHCHTRPVSSACG